MRSGRGFSFRRFAAPSAAEVRTGTAGINIQKTLLSPLIDPGQTRSFGDEGLRQLPDQRL